MNVLAIRIFGPILVLTGILGFVTPPDLALMSGAAPYNIFHLAFGGIALAIALSGHDGAARNFNLGFGLIDLYQALASLLHLWPESVFQWTWADDVAHIAVGLVLVAVALLGGAPTPTSKNDGVS